MIPDPRVNTPISNAELERRWSAVRHAMADAEIDVLVMQSNNDLVGGYSKYLTDVGPTGSGYPRTVIFPADGPMAVIAHGTPGERKTDPESLLTRGVGKLYFTNAFPSVAYTNSYDTEQVLRALRPFERGRIGWLGPASLSHALVGGVEKELINADFVDASDLIERIKSVKSPEESELVKQCAQVQDEAMAAVAASIHVGMKDQEVVAIARATAERLGSEAGFYLCGSSQFGEPVVPQPAHMRNRVIEPGDLLALLIECNGPGGMYTELGRTFVFGDVPQVLQDEHAFALEAQRYTVGLLRPDAVPGEIHSSYNKFLAEYGRPREERLHAHGQGYDLVERPLIRPDEDMVISAGMNMTVHPTYNRHGVMSWICDNWLIGEEGPGERLHTFSQDLIVVD